MEYIEVDKKKKRSHCKEGECEEMARVSIIDGYSFDVDKCNNHTLYYTETREKMELGKNGKGTGEFKEFIGIIGNYTSVKTLLSAVAKDSARRGVESGKIQCIKDYIDHLDKITKKIETIAKGF